MNRSANFGIVVRWCARILSVGILLFWGYFIIAHLIAALDAERSSRPLTATDSIILSSVIVSLAGLAAAWKWELVGGIIALGAVGIGSAAYGGFFGGPYTLIPIAAMLFLLSWWMNEAGRGGNVS